MQPFDREKRARWEADRARIKARMATSRQAAMQEILDQLQSPNQLREWLQAKQPREIVGVPQTPDDSILANFLWETLGVYVMAFGLELWPLDGDPLELPAWCGEFVTVDWEHTRLEQAAHRSWTAAEALAMLNEAERRIQGG